MSLGPWLATPEPVDFPRASRPGSSRRDPPCQFGSTRLARVHRPSAAAVRPRRRLDRPSRAGGARRRLPPGYSWRVVHPGARAVTAAGAHACSHGRAARGGPRPGRGRVARRGRRAGRLRAAAAFSTRPTASPTRSGSTRASAVARSRWRGARQPVAAGRRARHQHAHHRLRRSARHTAERQGGRRPGRRTARRRQRSTGVLGPGAHTLFLESMTWAWRSRYASSATS